MCLSFGFLPIGQKQKPQLDQQQFLDGNTNTAEKLLKEYIETYPQGVFGNPAGFYLAEIYFEKELSIEALPFYQAIVNQQVSSYTEKSLVRIITLLKKEGRQAESITYLEKLDQICYLECFFKFI